METFTCLVCRRDYDATHEKCPQCSAWQGDNKVMAEPTAKPTPAVSPPELPDIRRKRVMRAYLVIAIAWSAIGAALVLLAMDKHVVGGIVLAAGGFMNWHAGVMDWGDELPMLVPVVSLVAWVLGVPLAGWWMLTHGHVVSGVVDIAIVAAPASLHAFDFLDFLD